MDGVHACEEVGGPYLQESLNDKDTTSTKATEAMNEQ